MKTKTEKQIVIRKAVKRDSRRASGSAIRKKQYKQDKIYQAEIIDGMAVFYLDIESRIIIMSDNESDIKNFCPLKEGDTVTVEYEQEFHNPFEGPNYRTEQDETTIQLISIDTDKMQYKVICDI